MVVHFKITVQNLEILMKQMSREMKNAENVIVFHVYDTDLTLKHLDISRRRQLKFTLNISLSQVRRAIEPMMVTAYKVHNTGTLITAGKTSLKIPHYTHFAITQQGKYINLPQFLYLKSFSGRFTVKLECHVQFMVQMDTMPWLDDLQPSQEITGWARDMANNMGTDNLFQSAATVPKKEDEKGENKSN